MKISWTRYILSNAIHPESHEVRGLPRGLLTRAIPQHVCITARNSIGNPRSKKKMKQWLVVLLHAAANWNMCQIAP
jgi:hypothetical protein